MKTKKILAALLAIFILTCSLSACQTNPGSTSDSSVPDISSSRDSILDASDENQSAPKLSLKEALEVGAAAPGFGSDLVSGCFQLSNQAPDAGQTLPVYVNLYPYGQEGIMVPVTDELLAQLEENMRTYLKLAGYTEESEGALSPCDDFFDIALFYCEFGDLDIASHPECLKVRCSLDMSEVNSSEDFLRQFADEPFIRAAYEYLGITTPKASWNVTYNVSGEEHERIIDIWQEKEYPEQELYNRSFHCLRVSWFLNSPGTHVLLSMFKTDTSVIYDELPVVSAEQAQAVLGGELNETYRVAGFEVVYRDDLAPGYYVPCYRFYVQAEDPSAVLVNPAPGPEEYYIYQTPAVSIAP